MHFFSFFLQAFIFGASAINLNDTNTESSSTSVSPYVSSLQIGSTVIKDPLAGDVSVWYRPETVRLSGEVSGLVPNTVGRVSVSQYTECIEEGTVVPDWWNPFVSPENPWTSNLEADGAGVARINVNLKVEEIGHDLIEIVNHPVIVYSADENILSCSNINSVGVLSTAVFSQGPQALSQEDEASTLTELSYVNYFATQDYFQVSGYIDGVVSSSETVEVQVYPFNDNTCEQSDAIYATNQTEILSVPESEEGQFVYLLESSVDNFNPITQYNSWIQVRVFDSDGIATSTACSRLMVYVDEWKIELRNPPIQVVFSDLTDTEEIRLFYSKTAYRNHTVELLSRDCTEPLRGSIIELVSDQASSPVGDLDLVFDVSTDLLLVDTSDENQVQVFFQDSDTNSIEFCVRVRLNIIEEDAEGFTLLTTVSSLDTVVIISVDLTLNFEVAQGYVFTRDGDPNVVTDNAIIDYNIEACLCETPTVVPGDTCSQSLPELTSVFEPGSILGLCINTDSDSVIIARILDLQFLQDGVEKGPRPVNNGVLSELTEIVITNGLQETGANIALTSRIVDAFFASGSAETLIVRGVVEIAFSSVRGRRLQEKNTSVASIPTSLTTQKRFELSIDIDGEVYLSVSCADTMHETGKVFLSLGLLSLNERVFNS